MAAADARVPHGGDSDEGIAPISPPCLAVCGYGDHVGLFNLPSASDRLAAEVQNVAGQAHRAMHEGRTVFLARINAELGPASTGAVVEATEIIQAVEGLGWRLEQMSFVRGTGFGSTDAGYFLFRLPQPPTTPRQTSSPSTRRAVIARAVRSRSQQAIR